MDFRFDDDVEGYRHEVAATFAAAMAPERTAGAGDPEDLTGLSERFERAVHAQIGELGHLGIGLPASLGGGGRRPSYEAVFNLEAAAWDAPVVDTAMRLAGYPILAYGSDAQRAWFLPRLLAGRIEMCIAYSEEAAGSDLSAIRTAAVPDGDGWLLSGEKALVTGSHKADWCCTLARTRADGPPREAMTMLLVDLTQPGVQRRRRETMNGWTLGEIAFDRVRLGPEAVLGAVGEGWRQVLSAVQAERSGMSYLGFARHVFDDLVAHVRRAEGPGGPLADDPGVRDQVAALAIDLDAGMRLAKRALWVQERGEPTAVLASMSKVYATELLQRLAQAATEIAGHAGLVHSPLFAAAPGPAAAGGRFAWEYLERVHGTISVGANELQRDLIARQGLGLPVARRS